MIQGRNFFYLFCFVLLASFLLPKSAYGLQDIPLNGDLVLRDKNNNKLEVSQGQSDNTVFIKFEPRVQYIENNLPEEKKIEKPIVKLASEELEALFNQYGTQYNVDPAVLRKIAVCESGFNPNAINGPFGGMFQFLASTWSGNRNLMGLDPNPELRFNHEESIKTAAFKISRDGVGAWPVCGR